MIPRHISTAVIKDMWTISKITSFSHISIGLQKGYMVAWSILVLIERLNIQFAGA